MVVGKIGPLYSHHQMAREAEMRPRISKAKPALYKHEDSDWHWVYLAELARLIDWDPKRVFETFSDLANAVWDGNGWKITPLHWANGVRFRFTRLFG